MYQPIIMLFWLPLAGIFGAPGLSDFAWREQTRYGCPLFQCCVVGVHASTVLPSDAGLRRDPQRGTVRFLRGANLSQDLERDPAFRALQAADRFAEIALAFLTAYATEFRLVQPEDEMVVASVETDDLGFNRVRLQQRFEGIPVWGAELIVQLDRANHVNLVQGRYIPTPERLGTIPEITGEDALAIASTKLADPESGCPGCRSDLVIFASDNQPPRLAYRVRVTISMTEGWVMIVDAVTGAMLDKLSTVYE